MSDDVREVKSRLNIAEVIGDYVELRRRGSSLWGLCPFHSEKTPSFSVSPDRGTFHCFGCGKGGDVFTFIMEIEGLSFPEALERLAERAGVVLTKSVPQRRERPKGARDALSEALGFFRARLAGPGGEAARAYLGRRAISQGDVDRFEIGWAPASWDALSTHLTSLGISRSDAMTAGLVSEGERGTYDRFRGRVMFPVRDETGKITGFGGRLIDGDGAKYVNSPEGELFCKRKLLYLLGSAKAQIRARGRAILTEGYMDAIRCHLSGFDEAVASLGTSLTEEQAALIKRFTDLCFIVYDGDGAGQAAAIRGMYILRRANVEVRVVSLPDGRDPDEVLSSEGGADLFEAALSRSMPLPIYHVWARRRELASPGAKQTARDEILRSLAELPQIELAEYIPRIARGFGLLQHVLQAEIDARRRGEPRAAPELEAAPAREAGTKERSLSLAILSLLWRDAESRALYEPQQLAAVLTDEVAASIVAALLSGESTDELEERWRSMGDETCPALIAEGDAMTERDGLRAEHLPKIVEDLKAMSLRRRCGELRDLLASGEATDEEAAEYMELSKRLKGVSADG